MRRFRVIHTTMPTEGIQGPQGHIFAVHVQNPIGAAPALVEVSPGIWKFHPAIRANLAQAPGPIHLEYGRTNGIGWAIVPQFCELKEAQKIVEVAIGDALRVFDCEEDSDAVRLMSFIARRLHDLRGALKEATKDEDYERAAEIRDKIDNVKKISNQGAEAPRE